MTQATTETERIGAIPSSNLLTHSRMACAKTCLRKHQWCYELAIRPARQATPLRVGTAVHLGVEMLAKGATQDEVTAATFCLYDEAAPTFDSEEQQTDWLVERQTVAVLLHGYAWRWSETPMKHLAAEQSFDFAIVNPDTGGQTNVFRAAGKIDGIVELSDGRQAVLELKTCGEDLSPESTYWRRLRIDQQISLYFIGAEALSYAPTTILYDVIRKPSIRPKLVKGTRETPELYGERLLADITERPDFYYARQEIPRLAEDLLEFRYELWQLQQMLRDCQRMSRWPRNTGACIMFGQCPYFDLCTSGYKAGDSLPANYITVDNVNPELKGDES